MNPFASLYFIASSTFIECVRHKVLWIIVIFSVLLSVTNIYIAQLFSWDLGKISVEFGLSAVAFSGLLIVIFLTLKILADDFENNRIQMLLSRPISCWQYVVGKFLGLASVLLVTCLVLAIGSAFSQQYFLVEYAEYVPPSFSWITYIMALACQWMSLVLVLATTIFCYTFASNSFIALILAVSFYIIGHSIELLRKVILENPYAGIMSGQNKVVVFISWIFPNLSFFDKKMVAAYGLGFSYQEFSLLFIYCVSYTSILLFSSSFLLSKKDI